MEVGKAVLRVFINATIGFLDLGSLTSSSAGEEGEAAACSRPGVPFQLCSGAGFALSP